MRHLFVAVLLLCGCVTSPKQRSELADRPLTKGAQWDMIFPTGLRVVIDQSPTVQVAMVAMVETGSGADPAGREGTAHLVEHLSFRARHGTKLPMYDRLELAGAADFNAETRVDRTIYQALSRPENAAPVLKLLTQLLSAPVEDLGPNDLEVEREVVGNEYRTHNESGGVGAAATTLMAALFPAEHRYSRSTGGSPSTLRAITQADVVQLGARFTPDRITVVIVGPFVEADVRALVSTIPPTLTGNVNDAPFKLPPRIVGEPLPVPPLPPNEPKQIDATIDKHELYLAWSLPRSAVPSAGVYAQLTTSINALGAMSVGDIKGLTRVNSALIRHNEFSVLLTRLELAEGADAAKVREAFLDELSTLRRGGFVQRYLQAYVQRSKVRGLIFRSEDPMFIARHEAEAVHGFGVRGSLADLRDETTASNTEIEDAAEQYITADRARWVYAVPRTWRPKEAKVELLNRRDGAHAVIQYLPDAIAQLALGPDPKQLKSGLLPNGVELVVIRVPSTARTTVTVMLPYGSFDEPRGGADVVDLVAYPTVSFGRGLRDTDMSWNFRAWSDVSAFTFSISNPAQLNLIEQVVPYLEGTLFSKYDYGDLEKSKVSPDPLEVKTRSVLFPDHRLGKFTRADDIVQAGESGGKQWLARALVPQGAKVVITGNFPLDATFNAASGAFAAWQRTGKPKAMSPVMPADPIPRAKPELVPTPASSQVTARLVCRLPESKNLDGILANRVLRQAVEHRLHEALRVRAGATYGVTTALFESLKDTQGLVVDTRIGAAQALVVIPELRASIAELSESLWDDEALARARWDVARATVAVRTTSYDENLITAQLLVRTGAIADVVALPQHLAGLPNKLVDDAWERCRSSMVLILAGDPRDLMLVGK